MEKITVAKKSSEKNIIMDMEELDKITQAKVPNTDHKIIC